MNTSIFCCQQLTNAVSSAGERGIAIVLEELPDGIVFNLQARGISHGDLGKVRPMPGLEISINIAHDVVVRYCPWCGTELQALIKQVPGDFAALARRHAVYLSSRS